MKNRVKGAELIEKKGIYMFIWTIGSDVVEIYLERTISATITMAKC